MKRNAVNAALPGAFPESADGAKGSAEQTEWVRDHMETEQVFSARPMQITVETETPLPGGLREEARVYYVGAQVNLNGGELAGNRISADGKVNFRVLYAQGDLSRVSFLETSADFSQVMPLKEENAQQLSARAVPRAEIQQVSARAFNGRVALKCALLLSAEATAPRTFSFIKDAADNQNVEKAEAVFSRQCIVGEGDGQSLLKEEFELTDVLQIRETLFATAQARVEDILGGTDGKAVVTGTIDLEAYHTSDMPERPLIYTRHSMPFEQAVNLSGSLGDALSAQTEVRDVAVLSQDNGENGKILRAEVQLRSILTSTQEQKTQALTDVFTLEGENVAVEKQPIAFRFGAISEQAAESGKLLLTLPEGSPRMKTALLAFLRPVPLKYERLGEKLAVEGMMECTLIYRTDDSDIPVSQEMQEPFRTVFSVQAQPQDELRLTATQAEPSAVTGDRAEIKYVLHLTAEGVRKESLSLVTDVSPVPGDETASGVALYFLQPGEKLWDVARHYRMRIEDIRAMNPELEGDPLPGTPILTYKK